MIGNIACVDARAYSAWTALGILPTRYPPLLRVLLCVAAVAGVLAGLPALANEGPNTLAGAQDDFTPGKRPHTRQAVSARLPPYQAVGRLIGPVTCTGAIVLHPRIVVTAAHCAVGMTAASLSRRISFEQWDQVAGGVRRFEATIKAVGSRNQQGPQSVHDASQDWAVLLLDETPQRVHPLDIAEYTWPELQSKRGRIALPTYTGGGDENSVVSIDPSCSVQGFQWEVLLHDCSAGPTGSGAPLLLDEGDCSRVVGIHSGRILMEVDDGQMLKPMGNSAVGAWNFADPVRALAHQLEASEERASAGRKSLDACSFKTAGSRAGPAAAAKAVASRFVGKEPVWQGTSDEPFGGSAMRDEAGKNGLPVVEDAVVAATGDVRQSAIGRKTMRVRYRNVAIQLPMPDLDRDPEVRKVKAPRTAQEDHLRPISSDTTDSA